MVISSNNCDISFWCSKCNFLSFIFFTNQIKILRSNIRPNLHLKPRRVENLYYVIIKGHEAIYKKWNSYIIFSLYILIIRYNKLT